MKRLLPLIILALLPFAARAQSVPACPESGVQSVVNAASPGGTVLVGPGTCTWSVALTIPKGITVIGTGTPNTGTGAFGAGTLSTIIIDNAGSGGPLFQASGTTFGDTTRTDFLLTVQQSY